MLTLRGIFEGAYGFAEANAALVFGLSLLVPIVGIVMAWIGRGGRTDEDGRLFADIFIFVAVVQFVIAMIVGYVGVAFLERSLWDTDVLLLAAPWIWLVLSIVGLRQIFPLSELASWRSSMDVAGFFAVCAAFIWFLSMFRGWGILFIGSLIELLIILALAGFLIRQLFVRAFRAPG